MIRDQLLLSPAIPFKTVYCQCLLGICNFHSSSWWLLQHGGTNFRTNCHDDSADTVPLPSEAQDSSLPMILETDVADT